MYDRILLESNLQKVLEKVYKAHWESGNEAHSKLGYQFKKSISTALTNKRTNYTVKSVNGKRRIVKTAQSRKFGIRYDKAGNPLQYGMENFIQWRTYDATGTTVVGGVMKAGTTSIRENGRVVSSKKVIGVHSASVNILEKMNKGEVGLAKWINPSGTDSMKRFKGTHEKRPRFYIDQGKSIVIQTAGAKLDQWLKEAVARRDGQKEPPMKKV